ncbi:DUF2691 family protein [Bacillus nakamurai]|uniref:DUF2691 family protein n=1 Tax=Bacillus nakamurai TaxID=1793963 RepID=UPI001E636308|nr:DUF2691 family protein [Bacillus nakamurai]MCC9023195.1 DUF2691 family protein [Bacillus nakamurai]
MKRGITFEIPNEYGNFAAHILKPFPASAFTWFIGNGEAYITDNGQLDEDLFPENQQVIEGIELKKKLETHHYYMIFADLKAFPKGRFSEIHTYEDFIKSPCELVLLIADCSYATLYCKDKHMLELLYEHAKQCGFTDVAYITDENDTRTGLFV